MEVKCLDKDNYLTQTLLFFKPFNMDCILPLFPGIYDSDFTVKPGSAQTKRVKLIMF